MDIILEKLQEKIKQIIDEREILENKYYSDKKILSCEYETTTALLLNQKIYLEKMLKDFMYRNLEKND